MTRSFEIGGRPIRSSSRLMNLRSKSALWATIESSPMNRRKSVDDVPESRLIGHHLVRYSVDPEGRIRNVPLRIDVSMKIIRRHRSVEELYRRNLDDPVAVFRIQPSCLGVQYDLALHARSLVVGLRN